MSAIGPTRADELANVRKQVSRQAREGTRPSIGPWKSWLEEAFDGFGGAEALAHLEGIAEGAALQRAEAHRKSAEKRQLKSMTERILKEMDEADRLARLEAAQAEAKKRLGA